WSASNRSVLREQCLDSRLPRKRGARSLGMTVQMLGGRFLELAQHFQQFRDFWRLIQGIDLAEGDVAALIHDKNAALIDAGDRRTLAQNAVLAGDLAVGIEVAA